MTTTTTHSQVTPGVAGRTNYDKWDKVTRDLVTETEETEKDELEASKTALGLDGKYARSQAEAEEREKAKVLQKTKAKLDKFKNRQESFVQTFENVLNDDKSVFRLTRDHMDAFKRVVMIRDVTGTSPKDSKLVLTQDLSLLESQVPASALRNPKSYPDDAENSVPTENDDDTPTHVHGLIKLVLENIENCTVMIKCKFITGTIEFHRCRNMHIVCDPTAVVTTIQADLSQNVSIQFRDPVTNPKLFHAGVSQMLVQLERDGILESSLTADFEQDGAEALGAATKEEFRFVTQLVDGAWVTEKVIKADTVALTERDLQKEKERRAQATKMATAMAEDMIKIKDKDGNELVTKRESTVSEDNADDDDDVVEEVLTDSIKFALEECVQFKARGNEAFAAGEYGQAILQYSLALDKSTQLGDDKLFPLDVIYGNRSACFLKLGQHEKAEADALSSLKINPDYLKATFRLGLALHAMKRYEEALPILASAHKLEPKNQQIKQALQFCEVRMEQEMRKRMQS